MRQNIAILLLIYCDSIKAIVRLITHQIIVTQDTAKRLLNLKKEDFLLCKECF